MYFCKLQTCRFGIVLSTTQKRRVRRTHGYPNSYLFDKYDDSLQNALHPLPNVWISGCLEAVKYAKRLKTKWPCLTIGIDFEGSSNSPGGYQLPSTTNTPPTNCVPGSLLSMRDSAAVLQSFNHPATEVIEGYWSMIGKLFVSLMPFVTQTMFEVRCWIFVVFPCFSNTDGSIGNWRARSKVESAQFNLTCFFIVLGGPVTSCDLKVDQCRCYRKGVLDYAAGILVLLFLVCLVKDSDS